uniref:Saposin B-type domain-containing protein n=1 Tax=Panagrellus redivivus TaxID=6233 RepID=A0A7E4ZTV3_PANRE
MFKWVVFILSVFACIFLFITFAPKHPETIRCIRCKHVIEKVVKKAAPFAIYDNWFNGTDGYNKSFVPDMVSRLINASCSDSEDYSDNYISGCIGEFEMREGRIYGYLVNGMKDHVEICENLQMCHDTPIIYF